MSRVILRMNIRSITKHGGADSCYSKKKKKCYSRNGDSKIKNKNF